MTSNFVLGARAPDISISEIMATSVRVSWTQPMFSFPVQNYLVVLTRVTLCDAITSPRGPRPQVAHDMTEHFENLGEFITYRARVTANFMPPSFGAVSPEFTEMEFTTLGVGMLLAFWCSS